MKYFSMFSGVGGFEKGIQQATDNTWKCIGYSEINKYAIQIYQKHFKEHKNYGDATRINTNELPEFDLLVGGFPCQTFSIAGNRKGFDDTRGTLFFEIARILRDKRPKHFLLENVKGLLSHKNGETFQTILRSLSDLGYNIEWQIVNSKNHRVPQNRERIFIFGTREKSQSKIFPIQGSNQTNYEANGAYLRELSPKGIAWSKSHRTSEKEKYRHNYGEVETRIKTDEFNTLSTGKGCSNQSTQNFVVHNMQLRNPNRPSLKYSSGGSGHLSRDDISYCLDTGNTNAIEFDNKTIRRLTPIECERLQGFPDNWTKEGINEKGHIVQISDSQRYKCLGNAVTINVIENIIKNIRRKK